MAYFLSAGRKVSTYEWWMIWSHPIYDYHNTTLVLHSHWECTLRSLILSFTGNQHNLIWGECEMLSHWGVQLLYCVSVSWTSLCQCLISTWYGGHDGVQYCRITVHFLPVIGIICMDSWWWEEWQKWSKKILKAWSPISDVLTSWVSEMWLLFPCLTFVYCMN